MPVETREVLKSHFETDDMPTAAQFAALIDSLVHSKEDLSLLLPTGGQPGYVVTRQLDGTAKWADSGVVGAYQLAGQAMGVGSTAKSLADSHTVQISELFAYYEQLRDRSFVSIKDFGAQSVPPAGEGDGAQPFDSTEAIQNALNNGGRKRVFVPAGRFLISTTINIPAGVELFGEIKGRRESEIFCNENWTGGDMIVLEDNTILRAVFVNGAGACDYNINPGDSKNVLIKECSAADSTMAEISFYGQGLIEGGNYDRPPSDFGRPGASIELGGQVKIKDVALNVLNCSGSGAMEAHDVKTRYLTSGNRAELMFWRGCVKEEVYADWGAFRYGNFFGTKFGSGVIEQTLKDREGVLLTGCVVSDIW